MPKSKYKLKIHQGPSLDLRYVKVQAQIQASTRDT